MEEVRGIMKRFILVTLILIILTGCSHQLGNVRASDNEVVSKIQAGKTTRDEVLFLVGQPNKKSISSSGEETWEYYFMDVRIQPTWFVPIVNMVATCHKTYRYFLTVNFGKNSVVKEVLKGTGHTEGTAYGSERPVEEP